MAFIRDKKEERTGYQTGNFLTESIDNQCDFVMVYRLNDSAPERIKMFRDRGYVVHFMTGISWGHYTDYLYGEYDGTNHWDEAQTDRDGNIIAHGVDVPYMVPTVAFADYIAVKLREIVDAGVEAIHVEEPEFWDRAGYSKAFQREYETYYREKWIPPHESVDARYKCAKLKAYLYTRTIDRVSSSIKEYAKRKYNKDVRFYVPTHSLLNYTQWKIVSPEGKLADIPGVDGCIAQVWTGTSRSANWFNGIRKERTFDTAYLEYGVMQELVKGTGRHMWFLHDPIEDNPIFDWNDYRTNYFCTVVASLLHPKINTYEICPWPNRVFDDKYPKNTPDATSIPPEYATILNNNFNTLGTFELGEESGFKTGILMGDCELYQREYPDCCYSESREQAVGTVLEDDDSDIKRFQKELFTGKDESGELLLRYASSGAFPAFNALALPLLKYGVPVKPVLLDNARRYPGYLDDCKVLVMSYEFMKPDYPDINVALSEWVRRGGILIYIGDGSDPFNNIHSWWTGKYKNPAEHLFKMLGIEAPAEKGIYPCGDGTVAIWQTEPCSISFNKGNADKFREFFCEALKNGNLTVEYKNYLSLDRGEYKIAACLDESISEEPVKIEGLFSDMFTPDFEVITEKTLKPSENCLLLDYGKIKDEPLRICGTSLRIYSLEADEKTVKLTAQGAGGFKANIRVKVPFPCTAATVDGEKAECIYDEQTSTVLVSFESNTDRRKIVIY